MSKYYSKKTIYNGIKFDSIKEKNRFIQLKLLEKANKISELSLQKVFELQPKYTNNKGEHIRAITYKADFYYYSEEGKIYIVEDVKSLATQKDKTYRLKKKMFEYQYPNIIFKEVM